MLVTQAGDIQHVLIHLVVQGGVEEQHQIDHVVHDLLADLLNAAVLVGQEEIDLQSGGVGDHAAGGVGGAYGMLGQDAAVGGTELYHQILLFGMTHDCDIHGGLPSFICWGQHTLVKASLAFGYA